MEVIYYSPHLVLSYVDISIEALQFIQVILDSFSYLFSQFLLVFVFKKYNLLQIYSCSLLVAYHIV